MELQVLFIGNSHTFLHYMPQMLTELVRAAGQGWMLQAEQSVGDGASLEWHWNHAATQAKIAARRWDYVVLQDRSAGPLENRESFERHARRLEATIRSQGSRTVFYMTWAKRARPETQALLSEAYGAIARELGALLAPVGSAWQRAQQLDPEILLHHADGRHANPAGSYLAACVFFAVLLGASPVGLPGRMDIQGKMRPDLAPGAAALLQQAAWDTVLQAQGKDETRHDESRHF
jgi:hypothetical protein